MLLLLRRDGNGRCSRRGSWLIVDGILVLRKMGSVGEGGASFLKLRLRGREEKGRNQL